MAFEAVLAKTRLLRRFYGGLWAAAAAAATATNQFFLSSASVLF